MTTNNPFVTSGYAGDEYFCDRKQETKDIVSLLTNGNNIALISSRRIGKTDLIRHCFAQKEIAKTYYCFIIDIYSTILEEKELALPKEFDKYNLSSMALSIENM